MEDEIFARLSEQQQQQPTEEPEGAAVARPPPPSLDIGPLAAARQVHLAHRYLRLDGVAQVRIEGRKTAMVDELVRSAVTDANERDAYVRGARAVVPFGAVQNDLPRFDSLAEAKAKVPLLADALLQLLSYEACGAPLSIVRSRFRVGSALFTVPSAHGSLELASPVGLVDALAYDWRAGGYVLVDINVNDQLGGAEPEELLLRRSSVQRLHYCAHLLQRMFVEQKMPSPTIAYLLFVGYLTSQQRTGMWSVPYEPERWLLAPPPGRAPLLHPEDLDL